MQSPISRKESPEGKMEIRDQKKYTRGFDLMKVDRKYEMNNSGRTFLKSFFNFLIFYRSPKLVRLDQKSWA